MIKCNRNNYASTGNNVGTVLGAAYITQYG